MATMPCPRCGKKMVMKMSGVVYTSNPPQEDFVWWCGCGHTEAGGRYVYPDAHAMLRDQWEKANQ